MNADWDGPITENFLRAFGFRNYVYEDGEKTCRWAMFMAELDPTDGTEGEWGTVYRRFEIDYAPDYREVLYEPTRRVITTPRDLKNFIEVLHGRVIPVDESKL